MPIRTVEYNVVNAEVTFTQPKRGELMERTLFSFLDSYVDTEGLEHESSFGLLSRGDISLRIVFYGTATPIASPEEVKKRITTYIEKFRDELKAAREDETRKQALLDSLNPDYLPEYLTAYTDELPEFEEFHVELGFPKIQSLQTEV